MFLDLIHKIIIKVLTLVYCLILILINKKNWINKGKWCFLYSILLVSCYNFKKEKEKQFNNVTLIFRKKGPLWRKTCLVVSLQVLYTRDYKNPLHH